MKTKLDTSHKCILEHWSTFKQMVACRDQIQLYVFETATRVLKLSGNRHRGVFAEDFHGGQRWISLTPKATTENGETAMSLSLGIEGWETESILFPTPEAYCDAHVFLHLGTGNKEEKRTQAIARVLKNVQRPVGFELGDHNEGYVFRMALPGLTADAFVDADQFEHYFSAPLNLLIEWWGHNNEEILKAIR